MSNRGDIEFALRLRTDLEQGQRQLQALAESVEGVGEAAATSSTQLSQIGESADQQAARIRAMVEASLQQQAAADGMAESIQRTAGAAQNANQAWQQTVAAQNEAMNAYHNTERAAQEKAQADLRGAEAAGQAAAATEKEGQELQQLLGKIDPVIRKLDELDNMEQQLRRARASGQIDLETFDEFNTKLQTQRAALTGTTDTMRLAGITAGQYQQAMRMLPMQITDITTSLASGMPIWMVAVQQGGQIRDSFGGWANAGRALVSAINPLTVAIAAATAAIGATALAAYQGSQESTRFREQLILTGNAAGTSSDQLMNMAASMDVVRGTQRQASAALAEVAGSGRIAADHIQLVASAAVAMNQATGRAVSETVDEFIKLADSPVKAVAELNREYNFLSAAVYEQIAALAEQGDEAGAARLAMEELAQTMESRSTQIEGNLGLLESAWKHIKRAAAEAWDEMVGIGREQSLEEQLAALDRRSVTQLDLGSLGANAAVLGPLGAAKELWDQMTPVIKGATEEGAKQLDQERNRLQLAIIQRDSEAAWQGELKKLNQESIEAQQAIAKVREQGLTRVEQKEKAIAEYRANVDKIRAANPYSTVISDAQIDRDIAAIEKRYAERQKRQPADREQKARETYLKQLEDQAAKLGLTSAEVRQYELAEKGLTGAMLDRAKAAMVLIDAAEAQRQADADGKTLDNMQIQLLNAQGQQAAAAAMQIEQEYGELIKRLQARGDQAGLDLVNSLINVEQASAQLGELQTQVDRIFSDQARQESSIQAQQQAGLISEIGARQQIIDLHAATASEVEKSLPQMERLAAVTGDPAAIERVRNLRAQLEQTRYTANELTNAFTNGLQNGLQEALEGLAKGTMDLQEAATSFVQGIAASMASLAAQQLSQMAIDSIGGLLGGGSDSSSGMITGAMAVDASAVALSSAGASLLTGAAAIEAAAVSLAAASGGSAAVGGGGGGVGGLLGLFGGDSGGASTYTGAFGFAEGGKVRGPGTPTSDSILAALSTEEVVIRAASAMQPGATDFLLDFNARGMQALHDWAFQSAFHHSTGGLAGVPAPALASPGLGTSRLAEPAKSMSTNLKNSVNLYAVQRPEDVAGMAWGKAGQEHFLVYLQQNGAEVRQLLGI